MILSEVKLRIKETPISTILSHFISLTPKSKDQYLALCPFHHDTHPSLHVHDTKGLFRCFACDIGGDAITFVERYGQFNFIEAIQEISKVLGIPTDDLLAENGKKDPKWEIAYWLLKKTSQIYQNCGKSAQYGKPFEAFIKERHLEESTVKYFEIGFAPNQNLIVSFIAGIKESDKREKALQVAEEIGIIRQSYPDRQGQKEHIDVFRDRIMFPIHDYFGKIIGFSSRAIHSYQKAKYLNSKESFIFNKRMLLYGIHQAKRSIKEKGRSILVEGHMDVIMLHQEGFSESVAAMGTAINSKPLELLRNLTKNIYLALDSDAAGVQASERAHNELVKIGIMAKHLDFAPSKDPDEFLKSFGREKFIQLMDGAPLFISKLIKSVIPTPIPEDTLQKQEILHKIYQILSPLNLEIFATEKLIEVKEMVGLQTTSAQLIENYKQFLNGKKDLVQSPTLQDQNSSKKKIIVKKPVDLFDRTTKSLIKELILHPELLHQKEIGQLLENVVQNDVHKLFQWLKSLHFEIDETEYVATVINYLLREQFGHELRSLVGSTLFQFRANIEYDENKLIKKLIRDFQNRFLKEQLLREREELQKQQKEMKNRDEIQHIMSKMADIQKEIIKIATSKNY